MVIGTSFKAYIEAPFATCTDSLQSSDTNLETAVFNTWYKYCNESPLANSHKEFIIWVLMTVVHAYLYLSFLWHSQHY